MSTADIDEPGDLLAHDITLPSVGSAPDAARLYGALGWVPVRILPGKKQPAGGNGWEKLRPTPEEFGTGEGIGLLLGEPSGGLTDIDLDCPEAVALAPRFLPQTGMVHGRVGTPWAHWWYLATPAGPVRKFADPTVKAKSGEKGTLVELRGTGGQTVVPPTIHCETREPLRWERGGAPLQLPLADLELAVRRLAAAALLARHWPASRHEASLALTGALARSGWPEEQIATFVTAIASYVNDDSGEPRKRAQQARSSAAKVRAGARIVGLPTLISLGVPDVVIDKVQDWLELRATAGLFDTAAAPREEEAPPAAANDNDDHDRAGVALPSEVLSGLHVLGEEGDEVVLYANDTRRMHRFALRSLAYAQLVQIGGDVVVDKIKSGDDDAKDNREPLGAFKVRLALAARRRPLHRFRTVGQGLWRVAGGLLVVNGDEAMIFNGSATTPVTTPILGPLFLQLDGGKKWTSTTDLAGDVAAMTTARASATLDRMAALMGRWRFASDRLVMLASALAAAMPMQTVWKWRPHVWVSGKKDSGKSTLLECLAELHEPLSLYRDARLTEAGLRQEVGHDARAILLDEMEKNPHRAALLELLRAASKGNTVTRGGRDHQPIRFTVRHAAWCASIEVGLAMAADRSRFLIFELGRAAKRANPVADMTSGALAQLRRDLQAVATWAALPAAALAEQLTSVPVPGVEGRLVENVAAPVAFEAICRGWSLEQARTEVVAYCEAMASTGVLGSPVEDEVALAEDLSLAKLRVAVTTYGERSSSTTYLEKTVADILSNGSGEVQEQLEAHGVGQCRAGVFIHPEVAARTLLAGTRWAGMDLKGILLRLPGATYGRERLASARPWGVRVPGVAFGLDQAGPEVDQAVGPVNQV